MKHFCHLTRNIRIGFHYYTTGIQLVNVTDGFHYKSGYRFVHINCEPTLVARSPSWSGATYNAIGTCHQRIQRCYGVNIARMSRIFDCNTIVSGSRLCFTLQFYAYLIMTYVLLNTNNLGRNNDSLPCINTR